MFTVERLAAFSERNCSLWGDISEVLSQTEVAAKELTEQANKTSSSNCHTVNPESFKKTSGNEIIKLSGFNTSPCKKFFGTED